MLAERTIKSAILLCSGLVAKRSIDFASMIILARILTPEDFGLVAIASTTMIVLMSVTEMEISDAIIQMKYPEDHHFSTAWTLGVLRGISSFLIMCACAPILAFIYSDSALIPITCCLALTLFFRSSISPGMAHFTKALSFRPETTMEVGSKLVALVFAGTIAWFTHSYWAVVVSQVVAAASFCGLSYFFAPMRVRFSITGWRHLLGFSGWISLQRFVNTANFYIDRYLIAGLIGKGPLGQYVLGGDWAALPTQTVQAPLAKVLFAGLSSLQDETERLRAAYLSAQAASMALLVPIGLGMALVAKPLILIAVGPAWLAAVPIIQVLAPVFAFQAAVAPAQALVMARNVTHLAFTRDMTNLAIRAPLIIGGIIFGGVPGLLAARVLAGLNSVLLGFGMVKRTIGITVVEQILNGRRSIVSAMIMVAGALCVNAAFPTIEQLNPFLILAIRVIVCGPLYLLSHWIIWMIERCPNGPEARIVALISRYIKPSSV